MYIALDGNSNMESLIPLTDLARGREKIRIKSIIYHVTSALLATPIKT